MLSLVNTYYKKSNKSREEQSDQEEGAPQEEDLEFAIITAYEGQRVFLADLFKKEGAAQQIYNVDSFQVCSRFSHRTCFHFNKRLARLCVLQGNEADYIIISIAKTGGPGFLSSINRLNVMLTRCKRGLVVVTQKDFVQRTGGLLQGLWFSLEPYDPWVSAEDVLEGYVPMPGSPAPNTRPPPAPEPTEPRSRFDLPPLPGGQPRVSAARILQQGMRTAGASTSSPVRGAWGRQQGLARVKVGICGSIIFKSAYPNALL